MNFGEFIDKNRCVGGSSSNMPAAGAMVPPCLVSHSLSSNCKTVFNSPGLSLALQTGQEMGRMYESINDNGGGGMRRRSRDEEHDSRSASDNILDAASGDELDAASHRPSKKIKKYHRHTPHQIQQLEFLFKECPHPDEKQRLELSKRLCLDTRQVKFWFQNRRTQMKTQLERHENSILRQENDKLRADNMSMREAMRNPICSHCGSPAIIADVSLQDHHLRIDNARLKDDLDRLCGLAGKFLGRPAPPPMPNSTLQLGVGINSFGDGLNPVPVLTTLPLGQPDYDQLISPTKPMMNSNAISIDRSLERSMYQELALAAMDELLKLAQTNEPLWIPSLEGGREVMSREEYSRSFTTPCIGMKPNGFVAEASRDTGVVIINSLALVETMMDSNKWAEMFPCLIARTTTTDIISNGMGGTRNGALQLMHAELQVLSPLVPVREVSFLRFSKQHAEGVWAVVDVSIDAIRESSGCGAPYSSCRRLPSGCVVQDMPNGYSKVTWVEHSEYDESAIHEVYRPMISAGMGFGSQRWLATLQRQCEGLVILMSSSNPSRDHRAITSGGRRSMLKLAQRMTNNFCTGVCASTLHKWNKLQAENVDENVRIMTRKSVDDPGEPPGVVLSAATSVWLSVSPQRLFHFLRNEHLRSEWDILSNGGPMNEMAHIAKGRDHGNCVSLLRASANQSSMLILQETCTDASGSLVVYAPVDIPAMHVVMNGGDSAYVALLPSGFAVVPDGPGSYTNIEGGPVQRVSGSILTVAFQILVNSLPTAKLTVESVETVNNLILCTVQKIKAALQCESRQGVVSQERTANPCIVVAPPSTVVVATMQGRWFGY